MFVAVVTGNVVSTIKRPNFHGSKLLLIRQLALPEKTPTGDETIAVDTVDAGIGDHVLICKEGGSARMVLGSTDAHVAQVIVGVVDAVTLDNWKNT
jgi:microcompartment protein CcmK/EutM